MNSNKSTFIQDWLLARMDDIRNGKNTLDKIEVEYYDYFFEVHSDILETIWVRTMEGERSERSRMGN